MSRISKLFERKPSRVLSVYCTGGYPQLGSTVQVMHSLATHGADMIEIGMPYSDPLADGPVIQESSAIAIKNGITIRILFDQISQFRASTQHDELPIILMGYLNPVMQYGFERFCIDAAAAGVDGLILPDMPMNEFKNEYKGIVKSAQLDFVFLATPETSDSRLRSIDELSSGFLYAVSSSSTTGNTVFQTNEAYLRRLKESNLKNPVMVGFGIAKKEDFDTVCQYVRGAIVGSAFIRSFSRDIPIENSVKQFLQRLLHH